MLVSLLWNLITEYPSCILPRGIRAGFPVLLQAWLQYYIKHTAPDFPKISKMEIIRGLLQKGFY